MNNKEILASSFNESLDNARKKTLKSVAEFTLETVINNSYLSKIPFISTVIGLFKMGTTIYDRFNLLKMYQFIVEFNEGISSHEQLEKYKKRIQNDGERYMEYLLIVLQRYMDYEKPGLLAKLFLAFLDDIIDWDELCAYAQVLERLLPGDLDCLKGKEYKDIVYSEINSSILRLVSLGLMIEHQKGFDVPNTIMAISIPEAKSKDYLITSFGEKLISILFSL